MYARPREGNVKAQGFAYSSRKVQSLPQRFHRRQDKQGSADRLYFNDIGVKRKGFSCVVGVIDVGNTEARIALGALAIFL